MNATAAKAPKRNAQRTQEKILNAAQNEFCDHGYTGARMERIARRSRSNIRMIYHYFGNKEKLYIACLERIYVRVRRREADLHLMDLEPVEGMARLVEFTFDHLISQPEFVRMVMNENLLQGKFIRKSVLVRELTLPLIGALQDLLKRGKAQGVFHRDVDPIQLYLSILAVTNIHISNRYTLSVMFGRDLSDPKWIAARRVHVCEVILGFLHAQRVPRTD